MRTRNLFRTAVAGRLALLLTSTVAAMVLVTATSVAATGAPAPDLTIHSSTLPTRFSAGGNTMCLTEGGVRPLCDSFQVTITNSGSRPAAGPIRIVDSLPAGVRLHEALLVAYPVPPQEQLEFTGFCNQGVPLECNVPEGLEPDEKLILSVYVTIEAGAVSGEQNVVSVSEGGAVAPSATDGISDVLSPAAPAFGPSAFVSGFPGWDGQPDTQAADHPYELTTRIDLDSTIRPGPEYIMGDVGVEDLKDVAIDLPLGFLGDSLAAPKCTLAQLSSSVGCPADTQVGSIITLPEAVGGSVRSAIYNMVPERGRVAEFGFFDVLHTSHVIYADVVPSAGGYVVRATTPEIPQVSLSDIFVTFYGDPAARDGSGNTPVAMFTNPSDCSGKPLVTSVHMDSWQSPGRLNADGTPDLSDSNWVTSTSDSPPITGCNRLRFEPSLRLQPETGAADSPTGLNFDLKVPQHEEPGSLATPPLRNATVTLPAGLTVNPAAASGLSACSEAQIGLGSAAPPTCPESSKVGTVEVSTPLLSGILTGSLYLATQDENPFHSLLAGYIAIDDPATGVVIKVPGNLTPDPRTGQITGVFDDNPQLPFSELRLHFFGGDRGELATPEACGAYTTTSEEMPWSAPDSGPDATPTDSFAIQSGCAGGFTPSFTAGTENPQAGGYSPFTLSLSRADGEQDLAGLTVGLPRGLLGKLAGIPLCPEANANVGTCPEASRVGRVQAGAGSGPDPYFVSGEAYLTGPYNGGPYGLVEEVSAVAGPFNLGTVVVRQALRIDPHTAQVTAVSDQFPTILDGIPLRLRRVDVTLDRAGFVFNPTSCAPMAIAGTVTSTQGASASVSSRFQAANCAGLTFKPSFKVSTQAKASKRNGASLEVKVGSGQGQANIAKVAVTLPRQLPSRLTTIQQACTEATFAANPASCPVGSNIGIATARTPVLANPLTGPAYLVSHGGAAFPDLVVILQGEGITLDLVGSIDIKKGVTSSTFASVPDAPISTFALSLPEGPHSALAATLPSRAKGSLCGTALTMPTSIVGQNGALVKQATKISVSGCPKAKKKAKRKPSKGRKKQR